MKVKAREASKYKVFYFCPITCHWCHVMEQESFEDAEVAAMLNIDFIAIKVDREERPDIDQVYMKICQAITGHGGWPLTVVMTPEQHPFFVGTYFPKTSREGFPGMTRILAVLAENWREKRQAVLAEVAEFSQVFQRQPSSKNGKLSRKVIEKAYDNLREEFDSVNGGFGLAPKFPMPHQLLYLLRYYALTGEKKALFMARETLEAMACGGIYDQLGYGFARYSVDAKWQVPHFEKMLYDNALLAYTYVEAYQATGDKQYRQIAEEVFTYLKRDMKAETGGFYSAEDADSEGIEGKFYLWSKAELMALAGEDGEAIADYYSVSEVGNFGTNQNILYRSRAGNIGIEPEKLTDLRQKLWEQREKRIHPYKDDKILLGWNALVIAALAKGARALNKPEYLDAAVATLTALQKKLRRDDGRWLLRFRSGEAAHLACLDDYAYLCWALLELYEATFDVNYLQQAGELCQQVQHLFTDSKRGGYFFTGRDGEKLLNRLKEYSDGALPSGNSVMAWCLVKLYKLTFQQCWLAEADKVMEAAASAVERYPRGYAFLLLALLEKIKSQQAVIAGWQDDAVTKEMIAVCREDYRPFLTVILHDDKNVAATQAILPQTKEYIVKGERATAYICEDTYCQAPVQTSEALRRIFAAEPSQALDNEK